MKTYTISNPLMKLYTVKNLLMNMYTVTNDLMNILVNFNMALVVYIKIINVIKRADQILSHEYRNMNTNNTLRHISCFDAHE